MVRVYTVPVFNVDANIWWPPILPDDLATWDGAVPSVSPDVVTDCQLYYPKYTIGRWLHALSESAPDSLLRSATQELRVPAGTDSKAPWGVSSGTSVWSMVPLIECPRFSGRLYVGVLQEIKHAGFLNEYWVTVLAQIGKIPPTPPPTPVAAAGALGLAALISVTPPAVGAEAALGLAAQLDVDPLAALPELPLGLAAEVELSGLRSRPSAALGLAAAAEFQAGALQARAPLGLAAAVILSSQVVAAPLGLACSCQELLPSAPRNSALGLAGEVSTLPPKYPPAAALGLAATATYSAVVLRNPCTTAGAPVSILLACTSETGTLTGFTGLSVTLTYQSGPGNWQGTLTRSGKSGTITGTSTASGKFNFSGSSGLDWSISTALSDDTVTCTPWGGTSGNHSTTAAGPQSGNTVWSYN